jgi:aspartyl-tRNA synthetase
MAWADGEDVMRRVEQLMKALWQKFSASTVVPTFDRIGYHDAMSIYGSDKPDLRIPGLVSLECLLLGYRLTDSDTSH